MPKSFRWPSSPGHSASPKSLSFGSTELGRTDTSKCWFETECEQVGFSRCARDKLKKMAERGDSNYLSVLIPWNLLIFRNAQNATNFTFAVSRYAIGSRIVSCIQRLCAASYKARRFGATPGHAAIRANRPRVTHVTAILPARANHCLHGWIRTNVR